MLTKTIYTVSCACAVFLLTYCRSEQKASPNYMGLEEVSYVETFPQTFSLDNAEEIDVEKQLDVIGSVDFRIQDSLLIVATKDGGDGFWRIYSLPDYRPLGKFLQQGQGPYEFAHCPWVSNATFFEEKERLFAAIYSFDNGNLYKMNIHKSIHDKQLSISTLNDTLPASLDGFTAIDSTVFFYRELNDTRTQRIRYIWEKGKKTIPPHLERLNQATITARDDHNILSVNTGYHFDKKMIVEAPVFLNYLNLYSADGSFGKTICVGNKQDNIEDIRHTEHIDRIYTFANVQVFDKFWGVIHANENVMTFFTGRKRLPEILLFNWEGVPLAKLQLNHFITSFDIDFTNGHLYAFDLHTEKLYKYDIRDILEKL